MNSLICWPLTRWKWSVVTVNRCVRFDPTQPKAYRPQYITDIQRVGCVPLRPAGTAISLQLSWVSKFSQNVLKPPTYVLRINNTNVFSSHPIKSGVKRRAMSTSDEIEPKKKRCTDVSLIVRIRMWVERQIVMKSLYSFGTNSTVRSRRRFLHTVVPTLLLRSQLFFLFF